MLLGQGAARAQAHLGGHQSAPHEAAALPSAAIISAAILGLLPNHLEYLIRGKLRCPEQFWFPIPCLKARVNPFLQRRSYPAGGEESAKHSPASSSSPFGGQKPYKQAA